MAIVLQGQSLFCRFRGRCSAFNDVLIVRDLYHLVLAPLRRNLGNLRDPIFILPSIELWCLDLARHLFALQSLFSALPAGVAC